MKKFNFAFILVVLSLLLMVFTTGCGAKENKSETPTAENNNIAAVNTIDNMEMITGSSSGSWVPVGAAIAEKFNTYYDGFPLTAVPGPGSLGNPGVIANGDAAFGLSYGPFLLSAVEGKEPYDKQMNNLKAIAAMQPTVVHFLVDVDSSVVSVDELLDKKISIKLGLPPTGNASNYLANLIFQAAGMRSAEDLKSFGGDIYYGDGSSLNDAWKDRQINSFISTYNVPAAAISDSFAGRNGKILAIDGKIGQTLMEKYGFEKYVIKAGSYKDQNEDISTVALPIVVFTTDDTPEDEVYNMTKAIYEGKADFVNAHSSFNEFDPQNVAIGTGIDLHPGAIKFYKEVGLLP